MANSDSVREMAWPLSRLGEAIDSLARRSGLSPRTAALPGFSKEWNDDDLGTWIVSTTEWLGLEAEPVECTYPDVRRLLLNSGPALLRLPGDGPPQFILLVRSSRQKAQVLGADLAIHRVPIAVLQQALVRELEASVTEGVEHILKQAGLSNGRRAKARSTMVGERLSRAIIRSGWLLRLPPSAGIWAQSRWVGLPRYLVAFSSTHAIQYTCWVLSWWILGRAALEGRLDRGWLLAWALILFTMIPFRLIANWYQGLFAVAAGGLLKQRLLQGALRLHPDEIRQQGVGHHLGRVIESEAVESLALRGGFLALVSGIELVIAGFVLSAGAGGVYHVLLLMGWFGLGAYLGSRFFRQRMTWTQERLHMSHELVEKMVGHRTQLAQQTPERWHEGEDQALGRYVNQSEAMDWLAVKIAALPRGWVTVALLGLAPTFLSGESSLARFAVSLGGILLASRAMEKLVEGFSFITDAAIAWEQVAALFGAAARVGAPGDPWLTAADGSAGADDETVLDANELVFQYPGRPEPVVRGLSLCVKAGDRALLRSPSGGGKSTLVSLLNGLRSADSGLLLLHGLDRQSIGGEGWTRRIASAPQFNENHVFTETFAFNLLMGRGWPPRPEDFDEAETVCRELGLGDLLERMPGGVLQIVGETGWQLSHGERSRLFIARALLQGGELVILDESFAALDPETLRQALGCAIHRSPSLLVISHS